MRMAATRAGFARRPGAPCICAMRCRSAANKSSPDRAGGAIFAPPFRGQPLEREGWIARETRDAPHRAQGTIDNPHRNPPCPLPGSFQNPQPAPSPGHRLPGHPISRRSLASLACQGCFGSLPPAVLEGPSTRSVSPVAVRRGGEGEGTRAQTNMFATRVPGSLARDIRLALGPIGRPRGMEWVLYQDRSPS